MVLDGEAVIAEGREGSGQLAAVVGQQLDFVAEVLLPLPPDFEGGCQAGRTDFEVVVFKLGGKQLLDFAP